MTRPARAPGCCADCSRKRPRPAVAWGLCAEHWAAALACDIRAEERRLHKWRLLYPPERSLAEPDPCDDDPPDRLARGIARGYVEVDLEQMAD